MTIWKLRKGADRRVRAGHPWVYSNELAESPKGLEPGAPVELRDSADRFVARGYGNPHSLIAFRVLTRDPAIENPVTPEHLLSQLQSATRVRAQLGLATVSYRLCYGEGDGVPGLIIDRYRLADAQVLVIQAHTAGVQRMLSFLPEVLQKWCASAAALDPIAWDRTALVLRNDLGVRKLEGLEEQAPSVIKAVPGLQLEDVAIRVASRGGPIEFHVSLVAGQKTGFFLDQAANVQLAATRLASFRMDSRRIRILDLCCYVGQWGTQLAKLYREQGLEVEVTGVDASAQALALAKRNVEAQGARFEAIQGDVLRDLAALPEHSFDLVISDPPALIKSRKDIPQGTHAYLQLNTQAFRLLRKGGAIVTCSCSGLLDEESFLAAVHKAAGRNQMEARWVARGMPSPDHPMALAFPEGRYLKCWIGVC